MRKIGKLAVGAIALATASIANSAIIVSGSTGVDPTTVLANNTADPLKNTLVWGQDLTGSGSFSGSVDFSNNLSGLYSIIVSTSTPGAMIDAVTLAGILGTSGNYSTTGSTNSLTLLVPFTGAGSYRVSYGGNAPANGAAVTGNLTFQLVPVPEPATWALMLIGYAGLGLALRRRRRPALAQLA